MASPRLEPVRVLDVTMAVRRVGSGAPIVLLHGNPTSSWLWRHCIPPLAELGDVIAPDLVGMGGSDPLPRSGAGSYRFVEHASYLEALLTELDITRDVILVGHDWGAVLAIDWARRHADSVRGVAYMETIVRPRSLTDEPPDGRAMFEALRGAEGERMVLEENFFIDVVLANAARLAPADLEAYRAPFLEPGERRRPMLAWAREIPFDGQPADVHAIVEANAVWLETTPVPKLFIAAEPGAIITGATRAYCETFPAQRVVEVEAGHFVPEDAPSDTAHALTHWVRDLCSG